MSIILFPFRIIAALFTWMGSTIGLIIAAFVAAFLCNYACRALVWNGVCDISAGMITFLCVVSFILTLIAGNSKK